MSTCKSIILAVIITAITLYLGNLYSKLPLEIHHKVYEIGNIVILSVGVFGLFFLIFSGGKKSEPPTDDTNKNFTDINN